MGEKKNVEAKALMQVLTEESESAIDLQGPSEDFGGANSHKTLIRKRRKTVEDIRPN